MTHTEMLKKLMAQGILMRAYQKGFFSSKDKKEKLEYLQKSKDAEREFDNMLFNLRQLVT
jgi:hypothetical protein